MPLYEYLCKNCDRLLEVQRLIEQRDDPILCETCGPRMLRTLSSFSAHTKSQPIHSAPSLDGQEISSGNKTTTFMKDCSVKDCSVGVSIEKGSNVEMVSPKFENVKTPIEFRDK